MTRTWSGVLARLGVPTGDGRIIAPGEGSSRDLPLPLMWQELSGDGHGGSMVVARIESLTIGDGMVTAAGSMLDSAPFAVIEQLEAGLLGPSVDLDDIEYTMDDQERIVITKWRIAGATLVAIPAFADVSVTLDPMPVGPVDDVMRGPDGREMDDNGTGPKWLPGYEILASASPPLPPLDWFRQPDLDRLTPLTISDTGRVFGHISDWTTCHVGLPGCVTAPSSQSGYTYFHVASQMTAEGVLLPVGTLVAGPTHCRDMQAGFRAAQQHYDDPSAAVARVIAGEDEHGIWVAGWILPEATEAAKKVFMSSPVSGDWRTIGGSLEMIAVCSVNAPGFPVPRARVAFSNGAQTALIATSGIQPVSGEWEDAKHSDSFVKTMDGARARWAWEMAQTGMEAG